MYRSISLMIITEKDLVNAYGEYFKNKKIKERGSYGENDKK